MSADLPKVPEETPLTPEQKAALDDFEKAMLTEAIPEILRMQALRQAMWREKKDLPLRGITI